MDLLEFVAVVGGLALALVIVDTYFWIRTTFALRDWGERLAPVVDSWPAVAARFGIQFVTTGEPDPSNGAVVASPKVERAKNGRPFIRLQGGMARFITEGQARALQAGRPTSISLGPSPPQSGGADAPTPPSPPAGGGDSPPLFDTAGMAKELGVPEAQIQAFLTKYAVGGGGGTAPGGPSGEAPAAAESDPVMDLIGGLASGDLSSEKAGEAARRILFERQVAAQGGAEISSGGVTW